MAIALNAVSQFFDDDGNPLSGGKVWTYAAGTLTPLASYTNQDGNVANPNPVILDSAGRAQIWLTPNVAYKIRVATSADVDVEITDEFYAGMNPEQLNLAGLVPASGGEFTGPVTFSGGATFGGTEAQDLSAIDSLGLASVNTENLWINSNLSIWQRGAATVADGAYGFDRIVNLCETGSVTVSQVAQPVDGIPYAMRQTQPDATPKRLGSVQIVEARTALAYRGKNMVFAPKVRCSVAATIRVALVAWTGTADAPTRDVVNNWTSTNYTASNFFVASTTPIAVGAVAVSGGSWVDVPVSSISPGGIVAPSTMTNLYMVIWTEGTLVQNATLDTANVRGGQGTSIPIWTPPDAATELMRCLRYYYRLFASPGSGATTPVGMGLYYGATTASAFVQFPQPMRVTPTVSVTTAGNWVGLTSGGVLNLGTGTVLGVSLSGMELNFAAAATGTAGAPMLVRFGNTGNAISADAEI